MRLFGCVSIPMDSCGRPSPYGDIGDDFTEYFLCDI